jgi:hypothetical protein
MATAETIAQSWRRLDGALPQDHDGDCGERRS